MPFEDFEGMTGKQAHAFVKKKAKAMETSILRLCKRAKVSHVTVCRWRLGRVPQMETLMKFDRV